GEIDASHLGPYGPCRNNLDGDGDRHVLLLVCRLLECQRHLSRDHYYCAPPWRSGRPASRASAPQWVNTLNARSLLAARNAGTPSATPRLASTFPFAPNTTGPENS